MVYKLILVIVLLVLIVVYLFIHLILLKKSIKDLKNDFISIKDTKEVERYLTINFPDKNLEELAMEINDYIDSYFKNNYQLKNTIREVRGEITNISHDLRTPLTSILGYLELLNEEELTSEQKEIISVVKRRSLGLKDLIEQLYEYTRLENKEYNIKIEKIDLYKVLQEHILEFYMEFEKKNIDFKLSMPKEAKPIWINGDIKCIKRILTNLTNNALKYTNGEAEVNLKVKGNIVSFTYITTRGSLTDYDIKHIFDRFYKKDLSRSVSNSSGLGLTITRIFTERMGGDIYAHGDDEYLYIVCSFPIVDFIY